MTAKADPVISHKRSVQFYRKKWGGDPGKEVFTIPFGDNCDKLQQGTVQAMRC